MKIRRCFSGKWNFPKIFSQNVFVNKPSQFCKVLTYSLLFYARRF